METQESTWVLYSKMLTIGLLYTICYVSSIPSFFQDFIMEKCWTLSKAFSASIEITLYLKGRGTLNTDTQREANVTRDSEQLEDAVLGRA